MGFRPRSRRSFWLQAPCGSRSQRIKSWWFGDAAEEQGTLPNIRSIVRCSTHSAHKALENSLDREPRISALLEKLVKAYGSNSSASASSSDDSGSGGLARAITNSLKLQHLLKEQLVQETDQVFKLRYAKQRFGTIADVCGHLIRNVNPLRRMLAGLDTEWSLGVLAFFTPSYLLLLALVAEFSAAAMRFVRAWDGKDGLRGIAALASSVDVLEGELRHLFSYRDSAGNLREPFAMSAHFTAGYVQTLYRESLASSVSMCRMWWFNPCST